MALLIHLLLCATLISLAQTYSTEDMKKAILQKVGLTELPSIQKRDLENLVVPNHIKNKYLSMLKLHHARRRRSLPSLAGILRRIHGNIGKLIFVQSSLLNIRIMSVEAFMLNSHFLSQNKNRGENIFLVAVVLLSRVHP